MIVALGSDHGGFPLKIPLFIDAIESGGNTVLDLNTFDNTPVDYPDYARSVAEALNNQRAQRGVVICGSGVGASGLLVDALQLAGDFRQAHDLGFVY